MTSINETEQLREALLNLEQAREREHAMRLEAEALLAGLHALTLPQSLAGMFSELLKVFQSLLGLQDVFVLIAGDDGALRPVAMSTPAFADTVWQPKALFRRVLQGQPTAVFDVMQVEEWRAQPVAARAVKSALHIPLRGAPKAAILVCAHPTQGYFGQSHVKLARRFALLGTQALVNIDLRAEREQADAALRGALETLEQRTSDLELRTLQLQAAAEVSRAASSILDVQVLLQQAVDLIHERFGLYYVGLFLLDKSGAWTGEPGRWVVLRAGTGVVGRTQIEQGHRLAVNSDSMIGQCVQNAEARIALDVGDAAVRFANPLLPDTRSEMALPLLSRGEVIGAMTIQSSREAAFTQEDIVILQTMADQLANAIQNAHLFQQLQTALVEAEATQRLYVQQEWQDFLGQRKLLSQSGFLYDRTQVQLVPDLWRPEMETALLEKSPAVTAGKAGSRSALAVPILLRGQPIGVLGMEDPEGARQWSEQDRVLVEAVAQQLGQILENARLLEDTRRTAVREQLIGEVMARVRSSLDLQMVMQTAARELRLALKAPEMTVQLTPIEES